MKVSVLVPILYTEPQLAEALERLDGVRRTMDLEVLLLIDVPDPGREDRVRRANDELAGAHGARAVYRIGQRGFGSALRLGFSQAAGDALVPFMADCSDRPEDIPSLVRELEAGCDVVAGSRYMRGGAVVGNSAKQRVSRVYSMAMRGAGGPDVHDVSNAFKAYRRAVVESITTVAGSFDISVELTVKAHAAGFRVGEVPTVWTNRRLGRSNFDVRSEVPNYWRWLLLARRARRARGRAPHPLQARPGAALEERNR